MQNKKTILVSDRLYQELEAFAKQKDPSASVDACTEELLQKAVSAEKGAVYHQQDEEKIKERLQSLGYID